MVVATSKPAQLLSANSVMFQCGMLVITTAKLEQNVHWMTLSMMFTWVLIGSGYFRFAKGPKWPFKALFVTQCRALRTGLHVNAFIWVKLLL
jgi:hypothetical protein